MTSTAAATPATGSDSPVRTPEVGLPDRGHDAAAVGRISDGLQRLIHLSNRLKAQAIARAQHDVEWSSNMTIAVLAHHGPMRSSALAEALSADPSSVSRTVAALVADGMIERRPDPSDGRASLLVPTDKAHEVLQRHREVRDSHFGRVVSGWNERDLDDFARLLNRFTDDFETYKYNLGHNGWLEPAGEQEREGQPS